MCMCFIRCETKVTLFTIIMQTLTPKNFMHLTGAIKGLTINNFPQKNTPSLTDAKFIPNDITHKCVRSFVRSVPRAPSRLHPFGGCARPTRAGANFLAFPCV